MLTVTVVCVCVCVLCVFSLVELAATSMEQELQRSRSQEHAWNSSAMDLVRSSDVSSSLEHYSSPLPAAPSAPVLDSLPSGCL